MKSIISFILFLFLATGVAMAQDTPFKSFSKIVQQPYGPEIQTLADPSELGSVNQGALNLMNVHLLKQAGMANSSVPIVIISTGDPDHPELNSRLRKDLTRDTVGGDGRDQSGVSTAVNGTIAGLKYSATDNKFVANIRAFDNNAGTLQSVLAGLEEAYRIIGQQGGRGIVFAHFYTTQQIPEFEAKIREGLNRGYVIVTPAGDFDPGKQVSVYPASYTGVISVGAVDSSKIKTNFTGTGIVYAPGTNIVTTQKGGGTVVLNGTSQSATFVADLLAAYMTYFPGNNVLEALKGSLTDGVIDAQKLFKLSVSTKPIARLDIVSQGFAGEETVFFVSGSDQQNRQLSFVVDFGDFSGAKNLNAPGRIGHVFSAGNFTVSAIAMAGGDTSLPVSFNISIQPNPNTNRPPVINVAKEYSGFVGEGIRVNGNVTDPDGDQVRVFVERSDRFGSFDEVGQNFDVTRVFNNVGTSILVIEARDSKGLSTLQSIRFTISARQSQNKILSASATFDSSINRVAIKANVSGPQTEVFIQLFDGVFPLKPKVNNSGNFLYRGKFRSSIKPRSVRVFLKNGDELVVTVVDVTP